MSRDKLHGIDVLAEIEDLMRAIAKWPKTGETIVPWNFTRPQALRYARVIKAARARLNQMAIEKWQKKSP